MSVYSVVCRCQRLDSPMDSRSIPRNDYSFTLHVHDGYLSTLSGHSTRIHFH